jgi:hypothetical protein
MKSPPSLHLRPATCKLGVCLGLALAFLASLPAPSWGESTVDLKSNPAPGNWSTNLWLTQEYRLRTAGSAEAGSTGPLGGTAAANPVTDQDLRLTLDGTVVGLREHLVGTASAALWFDLDGHVPKGDPDLFGDAQGLAQPLAVVYALTAEWRRSQPIERLAVGRQQSAHGLPVTFDGGAIDLRFLERRLSLFAFGGRTVHFFEAVPGVLENWLVSGGAGLRLSQHLQVEVDSRYLHELPLGAGGVLEEHVNTNSYGATLMARWDDLQGKLFARGMNRSFSHVGGTFHLQVPRAALGVDGQAAAQLVTLGNIAESENPFYSLLGDSLPHVRARLEAWKEFRAGDKGTFAMAVGTRLRQLLRDQPTAFNRNMNAVYARGDLNDIPWKGVFVSAVAEWNLPTQATDSTSFFSLGGTAGYTSRKARGEAGTYFQRYKINYYRDAEELTNARTAYAMAAYRVLSPLEIRARYVVEIVDRTIHSAYLTLREDF